MTETLRIVGRRVPRLEASGKVTGTLRYTGDLVRPGILHGRFVRSPWPHALIRGLDDAAARAVAGVVAITWAATVEAERPDLGRYDLACGALERERTNPDRPGDARLFDRHVRYVGEPVALVLAETDEAAREAAALVLIDAEILPAVVDPLAADAPDAPGLHDDAPGNLAGEVTRRVGDVDAALAEAALVLERTFTTQRQKHAQLEPSVCMAEATADGRVTVWSPHQAPHRARFTIARWLGVPLTRVRVVVPPIGGAFGKADGLAAEPYAVFAALHTGRPVRILLSRQEDFVGTEARHPSRTTVTMGFRPDGTIAALRVGTVVDAGAYLGHSVAITNVLATTFLAPYRIPAAAFDGRVVFTTTPPTGAFRGYGGPQAAFPLEHLIDLGCRELGVDPLEARDRMRLRKGDPWGYRGDPLPADLFGTVLRVGREAADWAARRAGGGRPPDPDGLLRGTGMACTVWKSGIVGKGFDHSSADVRLNADGTVTLATAAADLGTGVRTTLAQICAEVLGLPLDQVVLTETDTDVTPYDTGAFASRSLYRNGQAVERAAIAVRDALLAAAAERLEIAPTDLLLRDGIVRAKDAPDRAIVVADLARDLLMAGTEIAGHASAPPENSATFCAAFADVAVDPETGAIRVERLLHVQDVGRAINPTIVEGQVEGALHQGLGYALREDLKVDPDTGSLLNGTFMDYRLATSADTPPIEVILVEEPDPLGPFGAKGVGEPGIVVAAPAVANAVLHAIGTCPTDLPLTPERVLAALRDAGDRGGSGA